MESVVGVVAQLRRFPLRSAQGESPTRARLLTGGLEHDRGWELVDASGEVVTARGAPALAGVVASVGPSGALLIDGESPQEDVERFGGPGARVVSAAAPHRAGAAVHLVTEGAADDLRAPEGCEPGERANVVLALDAASGLTPGDERGWAGRTLRLGSAVLVVTRTPRRCLGIYADVEVPGEVAVGDLVTLLDGGLDGV